MTFIDELNIVLRGLNNDNMLKNKKVYVIACYDLSGFTGITSKISNNYEEIKEIFDKQYSEQENGERKLGVTENSYKIIEINFKEINTYENNTYENNRCML